ncbi:MAG: isopenicillin N synthase family oxygenase [Gammaproteobacteria bacterium]|nr:isopenicillin N synthase family oxygenase [Gammaproteobacteria bacterium]
MTADRYKQREAGVTALNQAFRRYEQVRKDQAYTLSESAGQDAFDEDFEIQSCNMRAWFEGGEAGRTAFARDLGAALERIGFAILTGHGIDPALYEEAEVHVIEFFERTSIEERIPYLARRQGSVNQGYFPIRETTIIHPDLVEGWVFCRRAFDMDGRSDFAAGAFWPIPAYEPLFRGVCEAQEALILPVMQGILRYLGCDPHLYDDRLTHTNFGFRLNYYPPIAKQPTGAPGSSGGRMLGHEDVDLFTFLPAPSVEGLQVLNRRNMKWIRLSAPPGSIILNTGDYMQRITNDRLPSTTHRVARPGDPQSCEQPRVSFPMAVYVRENEMLEVLPCTGEPKYPPIRAETFHTRITSKYYGDDYATPDHAPRNRRPE